MRNLRRPIRKRVLAAVLTVLCIACVASLAGLYKFYRLAGQIYQPAPPQTVERSADAGSSQAAHKKTLQRVGRSDYRLEKVEEAPPEATPEPATEPAPKPYVVEEAAQAEQPAPTLKPWAKAQTFLLLGVDSRQGEQARADSILLATLPPQGGEVHLLSVPRDTRVLLRGHGYQKINHAMSYGGLPLMKRTVEHFLHVRIDHAVIVDFDGFRQAVDRLGGVPVVVEKNMDYDDPTDGTHIHLRQGQTLSTGKQALDYARFRHDAEADTGRMRRQQAVIRAIIQKGSQPKNWPTLLGMTDLLGQHVKTDLPPRDWVRLAMKLAYLPQEQIQTVQMRGVNKIASDDHLWYFYVDEAERTRVSRKLQQLRRGNE